MVVERVRENIIMCCDFSFNWERVLLSFALWSCHSHSTWWEVALLLCLTLDLIFSPDAEGCKHLVWDAEILL